MIRLVALICGILCGAGFMLSGLYDPTLVHEVGAREAGPLAYALALFVLIFIASVLAARAIARGAPLLGGALEPLPDWTGRKPLIGALLFGLGWGLSGYFPLSAFVSAGALSPGAPVFLTAALFGMVIVDFLTGKRSLGSGRGGSVG